MDDPILSKSSVVTKRSKRSADRGGQEEGQKVDFASGHRSLTTLDQLLICNCLQGSKQEATSVVPSPGGIKAN